MKKVIQNLLLSVNLLGSSTAAVYIIFYSQPNTLTISCIVLGWVCACKLFWELIRIFD